MSTYEFSHGPLHAYAQDPDSLGLQSSGASLPRPAAPLEADLGQIAAQPTSNVVSLRSLYFLVLSSPSLS